MRMMLVVVTFALALAPRGGAEINSSASAKGSALMSVRQAGRVRAPELEGGRGWLNTDQPLSLAALRGKVVLLDFWTYGCINCMHIIPDLQRLEEKYAQQLVVIGVHSAKFENERETENIRRVIIRYGIEHPVVNDADFSIWQSYTVRAWPTQILIDPAGYVVGKAEGEGNYEVLDEAIAQLVEESRKRGELKEEPLKLALERAKVGDLPLAFPGKVLADARGGRLFIADSNHHRIVVTKLDGTLLETVGTGERGRKDGAFNEATFFRPQGMALDGDSLYVADTANHLVRRVDLKARTVETVAGTGEQLRDYRFREGPAATSALSSPWDVHLVGRALYIAMAGPHQIWKLDLEKRVVSVFAGSGREARVDGARAAAAFAQPSGLASDPRTLYVADAESNIIRAVELAGPKLASGFTAGDSPAHSTARGEPAPSENSLAAGADAEVRTLAGGDLFEFGDREGRGDEVRLQHPLGLVLNDGVLYVADTYNHKIKRLDPRARTVRTFAGTGKPGQTDGDAPSFYEPAGLSVAGGKLYVADTNNHAVRVVDLRTKQTSTLRVAGLRPPERSTMSVAPEGEAAGGAAGPNAEEFKLAPQRLGAGGDGKLVVDVTLPAGYHLNPSAPHRYRVSVEEGAERVALAPEAGAAPTAAGSKTVSRSSKDLRLPLEVPLRALSDGAALLRVQATVYYCREDNTGTCKIKTLVWRVPVEVTTEAGAPREVRAQGKVE